MVDNDITSIEERKISTCTVDLPDAWFGDKQILTKLTSILSEDLKRQTKTYVMQSSSTIQNPKNTFQLHIGLDYLIPSNRGHFNEPSRDGRISVDSYIRHLVMLHHGGFRTPFAV